MIHRKSHQTQMATRGSPGGAEALAPQSSVRSPPPPSPTPPPPSLSLCFSLSLSPSRSATAMAACMRCSAVQHDIVSYTACHGACVS